LRQGCLLIGPRGSEHGCEELIRNTVESVAPCQDSDTSE
jgi:hypothetical protein